MQQTGHLDTVCIVRSFNSKVALQGRDYTGCDALFHAARCADCEDLITGLYGMRAAESGWRKSPSIHSYNSGIYRRCATCAEWYNLAGLHKALISETNIDIETVGF
jgi:hypothetical protein